MARFLQQEPPAPPEFGMPEMMASWKVMVAPKDRPKKPQHKRNIDNFFAVTLRDAGKVAIIDGDTKEIVSDRADRLRGAHFAAVRIGPLRVHDRPRRARST